MLKNEYKSKFNRNLGILTEKEQLKLSNSCIAIAGVGGVGGLVAERLTRLGVGKLIIADPEVFEDSNTNRQFAASQKNIGKKKVDAVADALKDINPDINIIKYDNGINETNIENFLNNADIVVEEIEFLYFKERILLHKKSREKNLFVLVSHSIGFGSPLFVFNPKGMTFEEYYEFPSNNDFTNYKFPLHKIAINNPDYADPNIIKLVLEGKISIPTLSFGCTLASSLVASEAVLLLLNKGSKKFVPECLSIDLYKKEFNIL